MFATKQHATALLQHHCPLDCLREDIDVELVSATALLNKPTLHLAHGPTQTMRQTYSNEGCLSCCPTMEKAVQTDSMKTK